MRFFLLIFIAVFLGKSSVQAGWLSSGREWWVDSLEKCLYYYHPSLPDSEKETVDYVVYSGQTSPAVDSLALEFWVEHCTDSSFFGITLVQDGTWFLGFSRQGATQFAGFYGFDIQSRKKKLLAQQKILPLDTAAWVRMTVRIKDKSFILDQGKAPPARLACAPLTGSEMYVGLCGKNIEFSCRALDVFTRQRPVQRLRFDAKTQIINPGAAKIGSGGSGRYKVLGF